MKNIELLAPAGSRSKLNCALYFGADAAYIGGTDFSLRAFANNFDNEALKSAISYAHLLNKKVYVTANIFAKNADMKALEDYFAYLYSIGADAAIISDSGVFYASKKAAPNLPIHISTQANLTNKYAVKFWHDMGASRAILARELSLKEISEIKDFIPEMELEAFVHGAMCISYSGRCLLSNYLSGRESNRGECVQACRWKYSIRKSDEYSDSGWLDMQEDDRGTYILNSKDLNMSAHLNSMIEAGISSFKIEGRMKSEYYLATVINAYRRCLDGGYSPVIERELATAAHRDYTTAYTLGENKNTVNYTDSQAKGDCDYIGNVVGQENGFALVEMRGRFKKGEVLEVLSPSQNFEKSFTVEEAYTSRGDLVDDCKLVQEVYKVKCPYDLSAGDILRRRKN
ncbi:MAG: U32 family peptidase [Clostridiales bacterium]|nr:U32 family peptidase [Clostridiales bacterium]